MRIRTAGVAIPEKPAELLRFWLVLHADRRFNLILLFRIKRLWSMREVIPEQPAELMVSAWQYRVTVVRCGTLLCALRARVLGALYKGV